MTIRRRAPPPHPLEIVLARNPRAGVPWVGVGRSMTLSNGYYWHTGGGYFVQVGQSEGSFYIRRAEGGHGTGDSIGPWFHWHEPPAAWLPDAFEWRKDDEGRGSWFFGMSCLSLMILFGGSWSAFLVWRWRGQRILTKAHDAAPAP